MRRFFAFMIIALCAVFPAHAATNTGTFPNDGKMLEDWTYTNAANETNVGTDGGNVSATANYEWNEIALPAGKYLPADTDGIAGNLANCTNGYYCAGTGADTVHYNQSQAQGLTACPNGYGNSAVGSTADTDCFRTCSGNVTIAHATGVSGNDYYGGANTCYATGCDTGYHLRNSETHSYSSATGTSSQSGTPTPTNPEYPIFFTQGQMELRKLDNTYVDTYSASTGKITRKVGIKTLKGDETWVYLSSKKVFYTENFFPSDIPNNTTIPISTHYTGVSRREIVADMPNKSIKTGTASDPRVVVIKDTDMGTDVTTFKQWLTAQYAAGTPVTVYYPLETPVEETWSETTFDVLATCEPNTYNITWFDTLAADVTANEAATATYGGNINTPVKIDPAVFQTTQKGKRFIGWTFEQPQTPSVQDPS